MLDENVDVRVAAYLRGQGYSVAICPKGITNGAVAALAKQERRVLLTNDSDFFKGTHHISNNHPGIIIFRIHPPSMILFTSALHDLLIRVSGTSLAGTTYLLEKDQHTILSSLK